jgi:soluble lytic murein transglycosylase
VAIASSLVAGVVAGHDAQAGPLGPEPPLADPVAELTPAERDAARQLGMARRLAREGRTDAARAALARIQGVPALEGYADLVRVHVLLEEGRPSAAHEVASRAIASASSEALRAALGVLQGEALATAGDTSRAEVVWNRVLEEAGADDEAVDHSIRLAIVAARQRSGSLDPTLDPRVLLDREHGEVTVASPSVPVEALPPDLALERGRAAFEAGRMDRAIPLFERASRGDLGPDGLREARRGRAQALFRTRHYEAAAAAYAALLPDVEARFWYARSLARLSRVDASLVEFGHVANAGNAELASWALFLMGTLHEDRGALDAAIDAFRRAASYEQFPERSRSALWREGWAQFRKGDHADARASFDTLAARLDDPVDRLRPRYWSARAAWLSGAEAHGRAELALIARDYPLTYYGWRARERIAKGPTAPVASGDELAEGTRGVGDDAIERIALLIEAGLVDHARDELRFTARRARGLDDRVRLGVLLARVGDYHRANRLVVDAYADVLTRGLQPGREALWWLSWPPAYRDVIDEVVSRDAGADAALVWAIMREESHYRPDARSVVGARGLLQLMPDTAEQLASERGWQDFAEADLFEPRKNIALGAAYLAELSRRFDGRRSAAIGSYNAGPRRVASWLAGDAARLEDDVWVEAIPYDQTRAYVKRVLRSLHVYETFYDLPAAPAPAH